MEKIKEKNSILKLLRALFPDVKIYLFSSRARSTARVTSDWRIEVRDICISK